MRVIAGSARGRRLNPPVDSRVRPTADRVKEALFSRLTSRFGSFEGLNVLDLFAGSGGLGIEALSRGAATATFVDSHQASIALTRKNVELTGFDRSATLIPTEAGKALKRLATEGRLFDLILADPPYADRDMPEKILCQLASSGLLAACGVIVFETDSRFELSQTESFLLTGRKVYGDTALSFFEWQECANLTPDP